MTTAEPAGAQSWAAGAPQVGLLVEVHQAPTVGISSPVGFLIPTCISCWI